MKLMWTPPPQASPLLGGEKEMPGHVVPTYNANTCRVIILKGASIDCDYVTWGRRCEP